MVRPLMSRDVYGLVDQVMPDQIATPLRMFEHPEGMVTVLPPSRLGPDQAALINNFRIGDSGKLVNRFGTVALGSAASGIIIGLAFFATFGGDGTVSVRPIRFTTAGLAIYDGANWNASTGAVLTATSDNFISSVGWSNLLLFSNQVNGLYSFNGSAHTLVAAAPIAYHIANFGNRVVASNIVTGSYYSRIQWSVKNDYTDWSGIGSGYEDLTGVPGGLVDGQIGVYPINDTFALAVRTNSIWGMSVTGFADAPFTFGRLFSGIGTEARQSVAAIPGGIIFVGRDDVYLITQNDYKPIGGPVKDQLISGALRPEFTQGYYDSRYNEYVLTVATSASTGYSNVVWRCKLDTFRWTKCLTTPNIVSRIAVALYTPGSHLPSVEYMYAADYSQYKVYREDKDTYADFDTSVPNCDIYTGTIYPTPIASTTPDTSRKSGVVEVQLDYRSVNSAAVTIYYSTDSGKTWSTLSALTLAASTSVNGVLSTETVSFRCAGEYIEGQALQLRIAQTGISGLEIVSLRPYITSGGRINW